MADTPAPAKPQYASIPDPSQDLYSLQATCKALKEIVETMTGQRGPASDEQSLERRYFVLEKLVNYGNVKVTARLTEIEEVVANETQAIAQRTDILEAEIDGARGGSTDLSARLTQIDTARVDGDTALSQSVTSVEAKATDAQDTANSGTASGQVALVATASPSGFQASYSWFITANSYKVGMSALVKSDGTAMIGFTASQFYLDDPLLNGPQRVFEYYQGKFTFNIPVVFNGDVIINGTIQGQKFGDGSVSGVYVGEGRTSCDVIVKVRRATSKVLLFAYYSGQNTQFDAYTQTPGTMKVITSSGTIAEQPLSFAPVRRSLNEGDLAFIMLQTTLIFQYSPGKEGFVGFSLIATPPGNICGVRLVAMELQV